VGVASFSFALEQQGFNHTAGVDRCAEEINEAKQFVRGNLVAGDALEFLGRVPDASLDFITALNFLEHLAKDHLASILTEVRRVLTPGGTLIAMVPNAISPLGTLTRHWDITHEWAFAPNNFRQLAALAGFRPSVDFLECGPRPHGVASTVRWALWQAIRASIAIRFLIEVGDAKGGIYTMDMLVRLHAKPIYNRAG
jgi:SAM-dependent methyltransferase